MQQPASTSKFLLYSNYVSKHEYLALQKQIIIIICTWSHMRLHLFIITVESTLIINLKSYTSGLFLNKPAPYERYPLLLGFSFLSFLLCEKQKSFPPSFASKLTDPLCCSSSAHLCIDSVDGENQ